MKKNYKQKNYCLILVCFLALFGMSCGGGGGGGQSFVGAAIVNIDAVPRKIDPADRSKVSVRINEAHENGVLLKVRYPEGLSYVKESAFIDYNGNKNDISPLQGEFADNRFKYLVFCFAPSDFKDRSARFDFELVGTSEVADGEIEVDPDVKATDTSESCIFNVEDPQFNAEDTVSIEVKE